jgi:uncharacterized protein
MILTDDKISHLSHLILGAVKDKDLAALLEDEDKVLREIKRIMVDELRTEDEVDQTVRNKIASYSRPIYEGSPEWQVLYQKFFQEELAKRSR